MKLVIINGSPRKQGRTGIASRFISKQYGAELIDLSNSEIPLYSGEGEQYQLNVIQDFRKSIEEADGVILTSPEYHGSMSGALKNALDFLSSDQFTHKPVALLAVSGGGKGGINALNSMRTVGRSLYANVISKQLVLDPHCFDYENDGLTEEPALLVEALIEELKMYATAYAAMKK
ncbi:NADPH-dependent FMN reductase [Peribacillus butanolivorans]|uniref:FMN-dependent NADH-azoreductase n=1 Tax=Peribacillus butanolivorans TaxID=421767 RepID=A0AAX0S200_9BACI|nr:NADPH-dependent FMN reductase [Peribacillus butanolivorans]AXN39916.1 NAD(P)H-dependent oxidoreductase [Peribacillus butanolivorans]PEJ31654.1 FMN-dependent NADH-azoreductase [Peribacillus butanolivorans]QNU06192.1 NAD(P)H-dependent oxidoreductase [Peribacillus butanolivorans]